MRKLIFVLLLCSVPTLALGGVQGITSFPDPGAGTFFEEADCTLGSIAAGGNTYSALQGAVAAETGGGNSIRYTADREGRGEFIPTTEAECLIGLDTGTALVSGATPLYAAWFANPIVGDGDSGTAEIFVADWAYGDPDTYQVMLLTSDSTAGIAGATAAATVQVDSADQFITDTIIYTWFYSVSFPLAGVGIDLDSEVAPGTQILGVMIPSDDGYGGTTSLDLCLVAAVPEPATVMLLGLGTLALIRRKRA